MKWKEALFTLNNENILTHQEFEVLLKIPAIRDKAFFPDYILNGYNQEPCSYTEWEQPKKIFLSIAFNLISVKSNRRLSLSFIFMKGDNLVNGVITDTIFILDAEKGWDILIDMDVLIKKRTGKRPEYDYRRLSSYPGSLEEKIRACLKQIKYNYDTYAADIINGTNWDGTANDHSYI